MHQHTKYLDDEFDGATASIELLQECHTVLDKFDLDQVFVEIEGSDVVGWGIVGEYAYCLD